MVCSEQFADEDFPALDGQPAKKKICHRLKKESVSSLFSCRPPPKQAPPSNEDCLSACAALAAAMGAKEEPAFVRRHVSTGKQSFRT